MPEKDVVILRIGHRPERDQRVTTHVGLTGRALGARGMYLAASDKGVVQSIADVTERWGGEYFCEDNVKWRSCIKEWKADGGIVVHLTMYGLNLPDVIGEIRPNNKTLVIVGAEKVPGEIYGLADYNVAVTGQPHSEISSLALFLDHLFAGTELKNEFPGAQIRIIPSKAGKQTEEL
ncbi:tRNA (cytidine(56)-2'-O)-methyltransferase [Methanoregula sp.]|uniref:tRNA (cytidine(56)-2'-O)-methyltransferase n=1 Tax=Methanoregula sp. TaxID=2052170 RepID=UPI000CBB21A5|nr:tRNA (cytidine(56)-2'-O)-methyltransferase [Methanoregula sp.]PKG33443.1 MAG: tRNA (cytidine(56)-2'-O)-methyltransferase [Methanoregula sp.]